MKTQLLYGPTSPERLPEQGAQPVDRYYWVVRLSFAVIQGILHAAAADGTHGMPQLERLLNLEAFSFHGFL